MEDFDDVDEETVELCVLFDDDEDKDKNNSGCCLIFFALGATTGITLWGISHLFI